MSMSEKTQQDTFIISDEVIASIAAKAVGEVDGFGSFSTRALEVISQAIPAAPNVKPIKVSCNDNDIQIQMYINVKQGNNAQAVSAAVQRAVKSAVQSMTGKVVSAVNVCVHGIDFANLEN